MDADFDDIRIIDLELTKTTWSRVHETLRVMFLRLDREPPDNDWVRLFFEERETRIVSRRRGLWIEDGYISFDTLPDEVEKVHIPDIARSIAYANLKYREVCRERNRARAARQAEQRSERDELLALQSRVRGLFTPATDEPVERTPPADAQRSPAAVSPGVAPAARAATAATPPIDRTDTDASATLSEFQARSDALKQRFRVAAATQDKEQEHGND